MILNIQGRHINITPAIHDYVEEQVKKIKNHFDQLINVHVVLTVIKKNNEVEVTISAGHRHFHNKVATDNMYKSIDLIFDKLDRQIRNFKNFKSSHKKIKSKDYHNELSDTKNISKINIIEEEISEKPMDNLEAVMELKIDLKKYLGFYNNEKSKIPSFIIKNKANDYTLFTFDNHWEKINLILKKDKLEVKTIENIILNTNTIEDKIDYILDSKINHAVFISSRTNKVYFIVKDKKNIILIREKK